MRNGGIFCLLIFGTPWLIQAQSPQNEDAGGLPWSLIIWTAIIVSVTLYTLIKYRKTFKDEDEPDP